MSQIEVDKIIPQSGTDTQLGESGDTITIPAGATITNNGTANGFGSADTEKVKVSANDTTAGFLNGKLVAGTNISLTEGTDGGNETLTAALTGTIATAQIADDAVTLAKMAPGTDGNIISYDASGNPVAVATGSAGQVLTSAGAGAPPTFAAGGISGWSSSSGSLLPASATAGIYLGVNSATAANLLDDYEEGTWTPTISGNTVGTGYYTKVGRMCVATLGDATTNMPELADGADTLIQGLPFSQIGSGWQYGSTPTASYADASASYHSFPLTGRQRNDSHIYIVNRSGQTKLTGDPVNLCIVYQTN